MTPKTLRVRARGEALVHRLEAMSSSPRQFIGREWCVFEGRDALRPVDGDVEIPYRAEYASAVKSGALWAADKATADACGVPFDPRFGGEQTAVHAADENRP